MAIILNEEQRARIKALVLSARKHGKNAEDLQKEIDETLRMVVL